MQLVIVVLWFCHFSFPSSICFCQLQGPPGPSGFPGNPGLPVRVKYMYFYKEYQKRTSGDCLTWIANFLTSFLCRAFLDKMALLVHLAFQDVMEQR